MNDVKRIVHVYSVLILSSFCIQPPYHLMSIFSLIFLVADAEAVHSNQHCGQQLCPQCFEQRWTLAGNLAQKADLFRRDKMCLTDSNTGRMQWNCAVWIWDVYLSNPISICEIKHLELVLGSLDDSSRDERWRAWTSSWCCSDFNTLWSSILWTQRR